MGLTETPPPSGRDLRATAPSFCSRPASPAWRAAAFEVRAQTGVVSPASSASERITMAGTAPGRRLLRTPGDPDASVRVEDALPLLPGFVRPSARTTICYIFAGNADGTTRPRKPRRSSYDPGAGARDVTRAPGGTSSGRRAGTGRWHTTSPTRGRFRRIAWRNPYAASLTPPRSAPSHGVRNGARRHGALRYCRRAADGARWRRRERRFESAAEWHAVRAVRSDAGGTGSRSCSRTRLQA